MLSQYISLDVEDKRLEEISRERQLSLSLEEMKILRRYYRESGKKATDLELETFAQTWSEHCCHKTFRGDVEINGALVKDILKSTVAKVTEELSPSWCFSVFKDNAGIIDFEGDHALAFKVETHNHPSALEPFGGAATGVGGVIRDILGVWGEPIANTNVLCFGPLDFPYENLPDGKKHPSFIYKYVVAGIGHYGNNMGIPTVNGAIYFDESYVGNPLIYCGTLGMVRKSGYKSVAKSGDFLVLAGGRTGRDGIHGVTFASIELEASQDRSVVQIGDPIEEEKLKRAIIKIRDIGLGSAITDLGGGGLSSAVGELSERFGCGAEIDLEKVLLKHPSMLPWEIWTSESQERMLICSRPENVDRLLEVFSSEEVEASVIGRFTGDGILRIRYNGVVEGEVDVEKLFRLIPRVKRRARGDEKKFEEPKIEPGDLSKDLIGILSMPNITSKESVIRTYDHEVKAQTVLKPLQGFSGPGDAAVIKPLFDSYRGAVISCGLNPEYGKIDPYHMAACAIDEAIRNNISVGGRRIALLDNFCWGNPEKPDRLWGLTRAAQACYDVAGKLEVPFISGKDSLYNESELGPVTPTLLISAVGIIPDIRKAVSMEIKKPGNSLYIIGGTKNELGGSHYYKAKGYLGKNVPVVDPLSAKTIFTRLTEAIDSGCVESCHDLSEGGLAVASAEMAFSGGIGAEINIEHVPTKGSLREDTILFSESASRFLVEVADEENFEELLDGVVFSKVGFTAEDSVLKIVRNGKDILVGELDDLARSWKSGL